MLSKNKNLPFGSFHSCQWLVRCTYPQDTLSFLQTQTTCRKKTSCGGKRKKNRLFFCVKEKTIIPKKPWQKIYIFQQSTVALLGVQSLRFEVLTMWLANEALRRVKGSDVALLAASEPLWAAVASMMLLGDALRRFCRFFGEDGTLEEMIERRKKPH